MNKRLKTFARPIKPIEFWVHRHNIRRTQTLSSQRWTCYSDVHKLEMLPPATGFISPQGVRKEKQFNYKISYVTCIHYLGALETLSLRHCQHMRDFAYATSGRSFQTLGQTSASLIELEKVLSTSASSHYSLECHCFYVRIDSFTAKQVSDTCLFGCVFGKGEIT